MIFDSHQDENSGKEKNCEITRDWSLWKWENEKENESEEEEAKVL